MVHGSQSVITICQELQDTVVAMGAGERSLLIENVMGGDVDEPPSLAAAAVRPQWGIAGDAPLALYTTGRLTSEMIIKSAQMGVPFAISRSGITQMGHQVAEQVGLCAIGRATAQRFLCLSHPQRLRMDEPTPSAAAPLQGRPERLSSVGSVPWRR